MSQAQRSRSRIWRWLAASLLVCVSIVTYLVESKREIALPPVLRIHQDSATGAASLQVPIVHYTRRSVNGAGAQVDFVGAVHLAERDYYQALNQRFKRYDSVLFELISDSEQLTRHDGEQHDSILGSVQRRLSDLLGLSFQLDQVDYQAVNFVHADLSPQGLRMAMQARGESLPQLVVKLIKASLDPKLQRSFEAKGYNADELEALNPLMIILRGPTKEERAKIKKFVAQGLVASDEILKVIAGEHGSSLIGDRNAEVISVLRSQIDQNKRSLAIFYGVGHLPDMHARLFGMGYRIKSVEWLDAWRL